MASVSDELAQDVEAQGLTRNEPFSCRRGYATTFVKHFDLAV